MCRGQAASRGEAGWENALHPGAQLEPRGAPTTPGAQERNEVGSPPSGGVEMQILDKIKASVGGRAHRTEHWPGCGERIEARVQLDLWLVPGRRWHHS